MILLYNLEIKLPNDYSKSNNLLKILKYKIIQLVFLYLNLHNNVNLLKTKKVNKYVK